MTPKYTLTVMVDDKTGPQPKPFVTVRADDWEVDGDLNVYIDNPIVEGKQKLIACFPVDCWIYFIATLNEAV